MVGGDANTWIGRTSDGTEAIAEVVGPFHRGKQTSAGDLLLDSIGTFGFMVPASFVKEGGPTYCGTQGSTSSTDHFLIPKEANRLLGRVSVCWLMELSPHLRSQRWSKDRENGVEFCQVGGRTADGERQSGVSGGSTKHVAERVHSLLA